jgi:hypothetical protein
MTFWIQSPFRDARAEGRLELPIRGHKNDDLPFCPSQSLGSWRQGNISSPCSAGAGLLYIETGNWKSGGGVRNLKRIRKLAPHPYARLIWRCERRPHILSGDSDRKLFRRQNFVAILYRNSCYCEIVAFRSAKDICK